jgi:hypothetical protein
MQRWQVVTITLLLFLSAQGIEWTRQTEISLLVSIVRSERTKEMLLHVPVTFGLGWKHPCILIMPDDPQGIAAKILRALSLTVRSNPAVALNSTDRHQRFLGVLALVEPGVTPAAITDSIPALRLALEDADPDIRNLAIVALTEANAITIHELQRRLNDPQTRVTAARAADRLGKKSKPIAAELLKFALHESQVCPYVTIDSILNGVGIAPQVAVAVFREELKIGLDNNAKLEAIERLGAMGSVAMPAIPALELIIVNNSNNPDGSAISQHVAAIRSIQCIKATCPPLLP